MSQIEAQARKRIVVNFTHKPRSHRVLVNVPDHVHEMLFVSNDSWSVSMTKGMVDSAIFEIEKFGQIRQEIRHGLSHIVALWCDQHMNVV